MFGTDSSGAGEREHGYEDRKRPGHEPTSASRRHSSHSQFLLLALFTLHT